MKSNFKTLTLTRCFILGILISIYYFFMLNINFSIFFRAIKVFFIGITYFNSQQLGSLVLTSSMVGLGIIVSIYAILFTDDKRKIYLKIKGWMVPTVSFVYAIFFSLIKVLIGAEPSQELTNGVTFEMIKGIGHISLVYFILGLVSLISWFMILIYKINYLPQKNE